MKVYYKGHPVLPTDRGSKITKSYSKGKELVVRYKFDKNIYDNLIPEFNSEFTDYEIIDAKKPSDFNYDYALVDEALVGESVVDSNARIEELPDNIVVRSIYTTGQQPTMIRFGVDGTTEVGTSMSLSLLEILYLNTINLNTCLRMFKACNNLMKVNCSNWDTSKVTDMHAMFAYCYKLTSLDLSNFDTSNVTDMYCMFYNCNSLTSLDVSNWEY